MEKKFLSDELLTQDQFPTWKIKCYECQGKGWIEKRVRDDVIPACVISVMASIVACVTLLGIFGYLK